MCQFEIETVGWKQPCSWMRTLFEICQFLETGYSSGSARNILNIRWRIRTLLKQQWKNEKTKLRLSGWITFMIRSFQYTHQLFYSPPAEFTQELLTMAVARNIDLALGERPKKCFSPSSNGCFAMGAAYCAVALLLSVSVRAAPSCSECLGLWLFHELTEQNGRNGPCKVVP